MTSYDVSTLQVIFQSTSIESIEVQLQSIWFECSTYARIILILSASAENWGCKTVGTFDKSSKSREKGINNINGRNVYNERWPCYAKTPLESMFLFWLLPISLVIIWFTNSAIVTQFPTLSFHLPQVAALIVLESCFKCQRVKHFPFTTLKWADSFVSDISQAKTRCRKSRRNLVAFFKGETPGSNLVTPAHSLEMPKWKQTHTLRLWNMLKFRKYGKYGKFKEFQEFSTWNK